MAIAMATNAVPGFADCLDQSGKPLGDPAQDKKRRANLDTRKYFQQAQRIPFNATWIALPIAPTDDLGESLDVKVIFNIHRHGIEKSHRDYLAPLPNKITFKLSNMICKSNSADMFFM